ncbi:hypothetical protein [Maricaulis maris]|uniref:Uncharacterized protein n=1 Tax=Maricaulis maris TaxID=74318 RepID=A0A495DCQ6_9PROT|nr:hypothetical protein [Maricaulis maris]RKR00091.1 hypothetical protein C7435_1289 [Maricaulis maris]
MSSQPIPVLRSVVVAYSLLATHWQRFALAGLPFTLAYAVRLWLAHKGQAVPLDGFWLTLDATALIAMTVGSLAFSAMAFRLAMHDEYAGRWGLQLSGDEWRLFIVTLLNAALVLIVALLAAMFAFVVFSTIAGGAVDRAGINPEEAGFDLPTAMSYMTLADWIAAWVVNAVAFLLVAWLIARLSVSFPASIAQRAVRVLSVWTLSEGQAWRIMGAMAVGILPLLALEIGLYEGLSAMLGDRFLAAPVTVGASVETSGGFVMMQEYMRVTGFFAIVNLPVIAGLYAHFHAVRTAEAT